ncbi:MAG TPA: zinc metalloprotease HtpX [Thermomicrobiales bacterium]|jgi:heat shock protein HtpX|nr:protease HtpX [Chloroflexota bacterium]HBY45523.1 protease HtpX [Chloroflexota bacterium]HCG29077.1 protease HtpX [Chloroflexota bacterium]HQZ91323.1 zinc metalloprotease HtpX [Thermomicrobiales bacterium]HRA33091.1 zinc metalloprotease HtpX [Thermomicrobiales bacterium]
MTTGNTIKTVGLLTTLTMLLVLIGQYVGGAGGAAVFLLIALVMNMGAWWFSDKLALRMAGAREVSPEEAPELHSMIEHLAMLARLPKPRVYIIENESPNAFATGRNPEHAAVAVTTGIQHLLNKDELAGVLAHELAHIRNRDTLISAVVATVAGAITWIASMLKWGAIFGGFGRNSEEGGNVVGMLALAILAPIAAMIIQLAISRSREFSADATGARILGDPLPLASALEKLQYGVQRRPMAKASPATQHLYIVNPVAGVNVSKLFSTHPPTEERVARLQQMALQPSQSGLIR